jgi:hypothetical protein
MNYELTGGDPQKPYPIEGNFNRDVAATQPSGMGIFVPQTDHDNVANTFGQVKYAKRAGATSIYKDETRNTANDSAASRKTESQPSCVEEDTNQGI